MYFNPAVFFFFFFFINDIVLNYAAFKWKCMGWLEFWIQVIQTTGKVTWFGKSTVSLQKQRDCSKFNIQIASFLLYWNSWFVFFFFCIWFLFLSRLGCGGASEIHGRKVWTELVEGKMLDHGCCAAQHEVAWARCYKPEHR